MESSNFICGGKMGDFIHLMFVVKNVCEENRTKADLYIRDNGERWTTSLKQSFEDLFDLVLRQPYINSFRIAEEGIDTKGFVNLDSWREPVITERHKTGRYTLCWYDMLCSHYNLKPKEYKWIFTDKINPSVQNKVLGQDHKFNTLDDLATDFNSCKRFEGIQSGMFALASALDIPRECRLSEENAPFYMGEEKYSKNISWYLNDKTQWKSHPAI